MPGPGPWTFGIRRGGQLLRGERAVSAAAHQRFAQRHRRWQIALRRRCAAPARRQAQAAKNRRRRRAGSSSSRADAPIGRMVAAHRLSSMILWGPPGCGKTTIARLLAETTDLPFEPLSAVFSGVADLRKIFESAAKRRVAAKAPCFSSMRFTALTAPNRTVSCLMSRTARWSWSARRRKTPLSS